MGKSSCCFFGRILKGWLAGAAGTTALNCMTYGDMAVTGRSASSAPADIIRKLASLAKCEELATAQDAASETTRNRQDALGALAGLKTGVYVGGAAGAVYPLLKKMPLVIQAIVIGGSAMAISDTLMAKLEVSDPATWSTVDWTRDLIPHLGYGLVTAMALEALDSKTAA